MTIIYKNAINFEKNNQIKKMEKQLNTTIIFTRYLYIKDEVEIALITSILDKKDKSLFWAYELYYSGFETQLFELLWKIYFDFYYTMNPSFYDYFMKKQKEWNHAPVGPEKDKIVSLVVNNLLIRPFNLDFFLLRQIINNFDVELDEDPSINIKNLLKSKDLLNIAEFIMNRCKELELTEIITTVTTFFGKEDKKTKLYNNSSSEKEKRRAILLYILSEFTKVSSLKMGKKLYVCVDENSVKQHETIYFDYDSSFYPYKILPKVYLYSIDEDNYLSLFRLRRNKISDLDRAYTHHWEYYATESPVWCNRIKNYNGILNHIDKTIEFPDDDAHDEFYDNFNYETDEQRPEIKNKSIQPIISSRTWITFYEEKKQNCLYVPDMNILTEFDQIIY